MKLVGNPGKGGKMKRAFGRVELEWDLWDFCGGGCKEGEGASVRCVRTSGWARRRKGQLEWTDFLGRRRRREPKAEKDLDLVGGEDERKKLGRIGVGGGPRTSGVERGDRVWGSTLGGQRRRREEVGDKSRFI